MNDVSLPTDKELDAAEREVEFSKPPCARDSERVATEPLRVVRVEDGEAQLCCHVDNVFLHGVLGYHLPLHRREDGQPVVIWWPATITWKQVSLVIGSLPIVCFAMCASCVVPLSILLAATRSLGSHRLGITKGPVVHQVDRRGVEVRVATFQGGVGRFMHVVGAWEFERPPLDLTYPRLRVVHPCVLV